MGILKVQETKEIGGITQQCLTFRNIKELTGGSQEKEAGVGDARYGRREACPSATQAKLKKLAESSTNFASADNIPDLHNSPDHTHTPIMLITKFISVDHAGTGAS